MKERNFPNGIISKYKQIFLIHIQSLFFRSFIINNMEYYRYWNKIKITDVLLAL